MTKQAVHYKPCPCLRSFIQSWCTIHHKATVNLSRTKLSEKLAVHKLDRNVVKDRFGILNLPYGRTGMPAVDRQP